MSEKLGEYTTRMEYDYAGRPLKAYRADGAYTSSTYDRLGNLTAQTDYMGNTTRYEYDALGRVLRTVTPFEEGTESETIYTYDGNGNVVRTRQQNNQPGESVSYTETESEYDSRNRLVTVKVKDSAQDVYTQYAYDAAGNMTMMVTGQSSKLSSLTGTLPKGVTVMRYEYDRFGNVIKETDSAGNIKTAEYNQVGLAAKTTDKKGIETTYKYNAYGSPVQIWTEGEEDPVVMSYTANGLPMGKMEGMDRTTGIAYLYDVYGNVRREKEIDGDIAKDYTYDVNGNRKSFTLSKGSEVLKTVTYRYDELDRIIEADFGGEVGKVSYSYDKNGRLFSESRGGITTTYSYNHAGLTTAMNNSEGGSYSYSYQLDGNMTEKRDSKNGTTEYIYDGLGQLRGEMRKDLNGEIAMEYFYHYDSRGNRREKDDVHNNQKTVYAYNDNNQLIQETKSHLFDVTPEEKQFREETNYEYDENGNVIFKWRESEYPAGEGGEEYTVTQAGGKEGGKPEEDYAVKYTYDNRNRLVGLDSESTHAVYKYDVQGRRKSKTVNGEETKQIWDGDNIVYETDSNWVKKASYYRGQNLVAIDNGTVDYYLYDSHGDVTGMKKEGGKIIYDAFGNQTQDTTAGYNPFRYNGQYTDAESGLVYLRARYYDPATGRFTQEDPIKDGMNWYVYCASNPVTFHDSNGLWMEGDEKLSQGAQIYTTHYGKKWEEANQRYQQFIVGGDTINADIAKKEMDNWHDLADDIRSLDKDGKVQGIKYDVQLFSQGRWYLCWAYSQTMVEDLQAGGGMTQTQADARAQAIAESVYGTGKNLDGSFVWDQGGWPTNSQDVINQVPHLQAVHNFSDLSAFISNNPVYAYYSNGLPTTDPNSAAHLIVVTGVASAPGHSELVASNNPWGEANIQTYNEFINGIPGDNSNPAMVFGGILRL